MEFHMKTEEVNLMKPPVSTSHKEGVRMDRLSYCLMFIFIFCLLSGCNPSGVSSNVPQQVSGNEGPVIGRTNPGKMVVANGHGEVGKGVEISDLPEQDVEAAPFAEDRFAHRPTRAGGMPTMLYPKGIPYSENTPLLARE